MIQVLYEWNGIWPEGGVQIQGQFMGKPFAGKVLVSPQEARRNANGYLSMDVAMAIVADDPILVWGERPVWRMTTSLLLADWGRVAQLGTIDVDAMTGDIIPLTAEQIAAIQERANELATRLTLETAPSG
ncbi:MAG: hypothetical protein KJZ93_14675 [Caldilineaceae bacterium]|nr:hypothetical protein [Caldilineaceae bacterium]